jgi:uncharacterized protein (TIGR03067 family)
MKTRLAVFVLLGAALASAGVAAGGDAKAELKKFEGTWAIESAQRGGTVMSAAEAKMMTFTFTGSKVTQHFGDKVRKGTFKINPGKNPRQIDVTLDKTAKGIYAFKGGKLTLCLTESGERPTEFKSPEGSKTVILVLKRTKE